MWKSRGGRQFNALFAGTVFGIHHLYYAIRNMCVDYLTDQSPDFIIETSPDDIAFERKNIGRESESEDGHPRYYSDYYLETLSVCRKVANYLLDCDTLLFHGSAIAVDGVGYLFTAKSGIGKSTHARLWRERFGDRAVMINDDKPLLKITENGVFACGTPWSGKHRLSNNICVPLKAICILERSEENRIESINSSAAFPVLLQQSHHPEEQEKLGGVLKLVDRLGNSVDLYRLGCNMEPDAAWVSYEGMNS